MTIVIGRGNKRRVVVIQTGPRASIKSKKENATILKRFLGI